MQRLDGGPARRLGRVPADKLRGLSWLPGGRTLSFLYGDSLYTVSP